jgi:putative membrane protein
MMFYGHGAGMGWSMIVFAVALPALIIAAVLILVQFRRAPQTPPAPDPIPEAERTLADRFARGEIGTEEYEERLRTLRAARR